MSGYIQIMERILIIERQPSQLAARNENAYTTMNFIGIHAGVMKGAHVSRSTFIIAIVIIAIVILAAITCIGFRIVPTGSMENTLLVGDLFLSVECRYGIRVPMTGITLFPLADPQPGELVVCVNPIKSGEMLVKRIIAVGGQTVRIEEKKVYVDSVEVALMPGAFHGDPEIIPRGDGRGHSKRDFLPEQTVPDDAVFVMGDNRDFSIDSRLLGYVPRASLRGSVGPILLSFDPDVSWGKVGEKIRWDRIFTRPR
jgi:signal peptidase I